MLVTTRIIPLPYATYMSGHDPFMTIEPQDKMTPWLVKILIIAIAILIWFTLSNVHPSTCNSFNVMITISFSDINCHLVSTNELVDVVFLCSFSAAEPASEQWCEPSALVWAPARVWYACRRGRGWGRRWTLTNGFYQWKVSYETAKHHLPKIPSWLSLSPFPLTSALLILLFHCH